MFSLAGIYAKLKEQNKLNNRLKNIFYYGRKGHADYTRIISANNGLEEIWGDRLNGRNLLATKPSKKQIDDFISAFDFDGAPEVLKRFMDFWTKIYLMRLYAAKYGMEIALGSEFAKSIIESNPEVCLFDIYLDKNATKICENLALTQRIVEDFMEKIAKPDRKFLTIFDDKMCAIVDFGALYDERIFDLHTFKKPKIITNPNNTSINCNAIKKALQKIDSHTNYNSTAISSEWEILEFLISDEGINKRVEVDNCRAKSDDSAQCDKILDTWRESCARGEEKYCIGVLAIHSNSYFASLTIHPTSLYECSEMDNPLPKQNCDNEGRKIDKSLTLLKQNCDKDMANSCYAVGDFYNGLYLEMRREESYIAPQMLDNALLYLQKSCDLGAAISCIYIAEYEHFKDTKQVKIYTDKARRITTRDCNAGVKIACDYKETLSDNAE